MRLAVSGIRAHSTKGLLLLPCLHAILVHLQPVPYLQCLRHNCAFRLYATMFPNAVSSHGSLRLIIFLLELARPALGAHQSVFMQQQKRQGSD
jgi:hypothetical protein